MFQFHSRHLPSLHAIILPHVTLSAFILISSFKCFSIVPNFYMHPVYPSTCFHFSFHVLWLCSWPFLSYYDTLYFYDLSSLHSRLIPTQYINQCIFLVVLQFVNWHWFISSPIFSLSLLYLLKSLSCCSPRPLVTIFTKTKLRPSDLTSRLLTNSRTLV